MTDIKTKIPAELEPAAVGGMVTDSKYVKDRVKNKTQEEVNAATDASINQLSNEIDAVNTQDIVPVDSLPAVGSADPRKIYRVVGETSYTDNMVNAAGDGWKELAVYTFPGIDDVPTVGSNNLVKSGGVSKNLSNRQFTNTTLLNKFIKEIYIPEFSSVSIKVNNVYKQYYGSGSTPRTLIAFKLNGTQYVVFDSSGTKEVLKQFFGEPICFSVNNTLVYMLVDWDSIADGTHFVAEEDEGILNSNTGSINACPTIREHIKRLQPDNYEIGTSIQLAANASVPNSYGMQDGWRTRFVPVKKGDYINLFAKDYSAHMRFIDRMDIYRNMSVSTTLHSCLNNSISLLVENDDYNYVAVSYYITGGDYYKLYKNGEDITSVAFIDSNHVIYNNTDTLKYSDNDIFNLYIKSLKLNRYILEQQFNPLNGADIIINATFKCGDSYNNGNATVWYNRIAITINGVYLFNLQKEYETKEAALADPIMSVTAYSGQITVDTSIALNNINSFLNIALNDVCFTNYNDYIINNDKFFPFIIQQSDFTLKRLNLTELIYLPKDVKGVTRLHITGETNPQRTYFNVALVKGQDQSRITLFSSNYSDIDLRDCYIDLFIDSDKYAFPLRLAFFSDVSADCQLNIELISKVPYNSNIENSGLIPSSSDILIEKNRLFIKKQDIWCGHALEVEKGKRYSMYIKTSRAWDGTLRLLVAEPNGNNRTAFGYDISGDILNSGYRFEFTASFTQQILMFYFSGDDDVLDNPYIDYELYGTDSNYVKTSKEAIKSILTGVNPSVLTSNIRELNIIKEGSKGYMEFDACIVGAGSAGLNAAAALIRNGYSVCVVDRNDSIGGTLTNAWINCCATTPDTPFFREIAKELIFAGKAAYVNPTYQPIKDNQLSVDYSRSLIRTEFRHDNQDEACITFDIDAYINKMMSKLVGVCFLNGCEFISAVSNNGEVSSITISDKNGDNHIIHSSIFIDSSADGVLCRYINSTEDTDFFVGSDATNTYQSVWGFTEEHASGKNRTSLNNPTLMFRTKQFSEEKVDLDPIDISGLYYYLNPFYYGDGSKKYSYCNSLTILTVGSGADLVAPGTTVEAAAEVIIRNTTPSILPYWKYTKTYGISGPLTEPYTYIGQGVKHQAFDSIAKMLGIRETYRIACERMLNENDLYVMINPSNLDTQNNLDSPIAIGNHIVDIHGADSSTTEAINENRKPYFVKYGSIVPKNLKNVFVACRGAGFTHIGAATFRLNKDMMQIGWMAGCAAAQFLRDNLTNTRSVDTTDLQKDSGFVELCNEVYNIIS